MNNFLVIKWLSTFLLQSILPSQIINSEVVVPGSCPINMHVLVKIAGSLGLIQVNLSFRISFNVKRIFTYSEPLRNIRAKSYVTSYIVHLNHRSRKIVSGQSISRITAIDLF